MIPVDLLHRIGNTQPSHSLKYGLELVAFSSLASDLIYCYFSLGRDATSLKGKRTTWPIDDRIFKAWSCIVTSIYRNLGTHRLLDMGTVAIHSVRDFVSCKDCSLSMFGFYKLFMRRFPLALGRVFLELYCYIQLFLASHDRVSMSALSSPATPTQKFCEITSCSAMVATVTT